MSLLTQPLGLEGWTALEPPLLAALATEEPLLLVGLHGTAKSFLLQRLAEALEMKYQFYNASLLNYDDLVGIPVPDGECKSLHYISTPTAVWGVEVVFIDEINRTRPDLQNKLFPLIHERRVQGMLLERLRYRWAAMNPPPQDSADEEDPGYLGAEPLDAALADRFSFILAVPDWEDLTEDEKRRLLVDQFAGRHEFPVPVREIVGRTRRVYMGFRENPPPGLCDYVSCLSTQWLAAGNRLSPRRNANLLRNILAVHAARVVLARAADPSADVRQVEWETSAWLAVRHSQPRLAQTGRIDMTALLATHRHAWKLAGLEADSPWCALLRIGHPADRFVAALKLGDLLDDHDLGQLLLDAMGSIPVPAHRTAFALAAYLALHSDRDIPATVVETLAGHVARVLRPDARNMMVHDPAVGPCREVGQVCSRLEPGGGPPSRDAYLRNLLESLLPDGFTRTSVGEVCRQFDAWWARLELDRVFPAGEDR